MNDFKGLLKAGKWFLLFRVIVAILAMVLFFNVRQNHKRIWQVDMEAEKTSLSNKNYRRPAGMVLPIFFTCSSFFLRSVFCLFSRPGPRA